MSQESLLLRQFGIKLKHNQIDQAYKIFTNNYKEELEKAKAILKDNKNEQTFLDIVTNSYKSEIQSKNAKVQLIDFTYHVKTVDSQDIESIIQRAYFNSFNLQRAKINQSNNIPAVENSQINNIKGKKSIINQKKFQKQQIDNQDKEQCFCGKVLVGQNWVECDNGQECKGSTWYHYSCVGLEQNQNLQGVNFVCKFCKKNGDNNQNNQLKSQPAPNNKKSKSAKN